MLHLQAQRLLSTTSLKDELGKSLQTHDLLLASVSLRLFKLLRQRCINALLGHHLCLPLLEVKVGARIFVDWHQTLLIEISDDI